MKRIKIKPLNKNDVCMVVNQPDEDKIVIAIKHGYVFTDYYFCKDSSGKLLFYPRKNLFKLFNLND